jgi:hypothetical protein
LQPGGDFFNPDSTGLQGRRGNYGYNAYQLESDMQAYALQFGGNHHLSKIDLNYNVGWAYSELLSKQYDIPFSAAALGLDYRIDMTDRSQPYHAHHKSSCERRRYGVLCACQAARSSPKVRAGADGSAVSCQTLQMWTLPFSLGSLKIGSNYLYRIWDRTHSEASFRHAQSKNLSNFRPMLTEYYEVLDQSGIPDPVDDQHRPGPVVVPGPEARIF